MTPRRKILVGAGVVLLLGVLVFQALRADRGDAVEVRAEVVTERDLVARVTATGHIEPKRSVDVQSDISGRVVEVHVEEGDEVEEGELLLAIDPTQYEAAVRQARARLAEARARLARAETDLQQYRWEWDRIRKLKERTQDLVTEQEAEQTRTRAELAEAERQAAQFAVEQAEAALEEAEDRLAKTVIRAPMGGRVTRLNVEKGETAIVGTMNNPGTVLLTVADLSVMEAVAEVDETDVTQVEVGDSASVEIDAFPDRSFPGRVTKIGNSSLRPRGASASPGGDEAVDFEVRVTLRDPPEGIRPDLSCSVDIVTDERPGATAIPIISLTLVDTASLAEGWRERLPPSMRTGEADRGPRDAADLRGEVEGVYVVSDGRARFQPVRVGIAGDRYFQVLEGLAPGDTVVAGPYQAIRRLEDGRPVKLERVE